MNLELYIQKYLNILNIYIIIKHDIVYYGIQIKRNTIL